MTSITTMDHIKPASFQLRPRVSSFLPPVANPFVQKVVLTCWQKFQIAVMSMTFAPIKFILMLLSIFVTWLFARFATIGIKLPREKPVSRFRSMLFSIVRKLMRLMFFVIGFHIVRVRGKRASSKDAPIVVIAPHSSFLDSVILVVSDPMPSGLSRIENLQIPFMGIVGKTSQPVFVSRNDPDSRRKAVDDIRQRVSFPGKWPQIFIFPEGTCTNRKALITFKSGAFIPGCAVQPVLIEYLNKFDSFTWTMSGLNTWQVLWYTMCQFTVKFRVTYLPVYHPCEEEVNDHTLYARNVRSLMASGLNIPCTDHTFEDCRLMLKASKLKLPREAGLVEFAKISEKLGMNIDNVQDILQEFSEIACEKPDGLVSLEDFAKYLNMPISDAVKDMFHLYDRSDTGLIDFREYVIGLSLVSRPAATEETVKLAFKMFDEDHDGIVSRDEFIHAVYAVFENEISGNVIYDNVPKLNQNGITFDEFNAFLLNKPEYAKLFLWYKEMVQGSDFETISLRSFATKLKDTLHRKRLRSAR